MEGLNNEQMLAVQAVEGPVIVFAGAGSGKTRTLTYRIAYMIMHSKIPPYNILAITFTNKATNEMRDRLKSFIDVDASKVTISTFHSLCAMILRREITALGYRKDFSIVDEEDQLKVITEVIKEMGLEKSKARHYQKEINYNKCFMIPPKEAGDPELVKIHERYEDKMLEENLLDFEDLLIKVYELFNTNEEVLKKYQNKYKYILVDEFQDTNTIQYKIVKLLAKESRNLFVVGDDDQSIYSFRGTNYENISLFKEDFPEHKLFTLCQNYRSTKPIIDAANRLIRNNKNREVKEMTCDKEGNLDDISIYKAYNENEEVEYIINRINALKSSRDSYSDFAILYRSSVLLRNVELGLIRHQIPYKVFGGVSYLRRKEIKDIIAYIKLMINHNDINSFKRIVNVPSRGIGNVTIETVLKVKKENSVDVIKAIELCEKVLSKKRFEELNKFKNIIKEFSEKLDTDNLLEVFEELMKILQYREYLNDLYEKKEAEDRIANLNEFKSILYAIEANTLSGNKVDYMREAFDDAILSDSYLQGQNESWEGVTVSTIHSVKGLEFKYVFIIGLEDNLFPNKSRIISNDEFEEERRICYVALTRAKEKAIITHCGRRLLYGSTYQNKPSQFISEIMGDRGYNDLETSSIRPGLSVPKKEIPNYTNKLPITGKTNGEKTSVEYNIGDKVYHTKFGEGMIIGIKNGIGNIFFDKEKASKSILLDHPALSKL